MHKLASILAAIVLLVGTTLAEPKKGPGAGGGPRAGHVPNNIEKLSGMSEKQREKQLAKLPPERRARVERGLEQYNKLPPQEREWLLRQLDEFHKLPPPQQERARLLFQQYKSLPPERQSAVKTEVRRLRSMNEEDRRGHMNTEEFRNKFSPEEQRLLHQVVVTPPVEYRGENDSCKILTDRSEDGQSRSWR